MAEGHPFLLHGFQVRHKINQVAGIVVCKNEDDVWLSRNGCLSISREYTEPCKQGEEKAFEAIHGKLLVLLKVLYKSGQNSRIKAQGCDWVLEVIINCLTFNYHRP